MYEISWVVSISSFKRQFRTDMGMDFCLQSRSLDDLMILLSHPAVFCTEFTVHLIEFASEAFPRRFQDFLDV